MSGLYDVEYDWSQGTSLPVNVDHRFIEAAPLLATQFFAIDVQTQTIVPTFTLDGVPFPIDLVGHGPEHGHFFLFEPAGGSIPVGPSDAESPPSVLLIRGDYEVGYEWGAGTTMPINPKHVVTTATVPEPQTALSLVVGALFVRILVSRRAAWAAVLGDRRSAHHRSEGSPIAWRSGTPMRSAISRCSRCTSHSLRPSTKSSPGARVGASIRLIPI